MMASSAFPAPGPAGSPDGADGAGAGTDVSVSGAGVADGVDVPDAVADGPDDVGWPDPVPAEQADIRPADTATANTWISNLRTRPASSDCSHSTAGSAGARLPEPVAPPVAAISPIMAPCSSATWSRVRPRRSIMVPGTASASCRRSAPAGVSSTARARSFPSTRRRVRSPAASRRRRSGEMVAGSWASASLIFRTVRGLSSHRHSITRYCGWVSPSFSRTGL